jgi:hypothetical protein
MPTNSDRAAWADAAINVFRDLTLCDHEDSLSLT